MNVRNNEAMFDWIALCLGANVYVLPPGQGRVVGVDVVGFMPVGRDVLLAFFASNTFRTMTWLMMANGYVIQMK